VASTLSWHSVRISLACALHAVNCPDATIQLICRWASPDSLELYRLIGTSSHIAVLQASFALDNSLDYAALAAPTPPYRAGARQAVAAAAAVSAPAPPVHSPPPPPLPTGSRLEILWADPPRLFAGTCTSHRVQLHEDGSMVRRGPWPPDGKRAWAVPVA
jgi:hypothetical protein